MIKKNYILLILLIQNFSLFAANADNVETFKDEQPPQTVKYYKEQTTKWINGIELKIVKNEITNKTNLSTISQTFSAYTTTHYPANEIVTEENKELFRKFYDDQTDQYHEFHATFTQTETRYVYLYDIIQILRKPEAEISFFDKVKMKQFKGRLLTKQIKLHKEALAELLGKLNDKITILTITNPELDTYKNHLIDYANGHDMSENVLYTFGNNFTGKDIIDARTNRETLKLKTRYRLTTAAACALPWLPKIPMASTMASSAFDFLQNTFGRATLPVIAGTGLLAAYGTAPSFLRMLNSGKQPISNKKIGSNAAFLGFSGGFSFGMANGFSALGSLGLGVAGMLTTIGFAGLADYQNEKRNYNCALKAITEQNFEESFPGITRQLTVLQEASRKRFFIKESEV